MILHPIGNLTTPAAAFYRTKIFCFGSFSLEPLCFSLQCNYWVLYLGVSPILKLIIKLIVIEFFLIHDILILQVQRSIIEIIFLHTNLACKWSIIRTTIIIGCEGLQQEVDRILPTCTERISNREDIFIKIGDVVSK